VSERQTASSSGMHAKRSIWRSGERDVIVIVGFGARAVAINRLALFQLTVLGS
jgi:hypothetical protein